ALLGCIIPCIQEFHQLEEPFLHIPAANDLKIKIFNKNNKLNKYNSHKNKICTNKCTNKKGAQYEGSDWF
ncbi:hypothetical protein ABS872_23485, partial [Photorhabdus laumondii]|uniref:hypothetical protein n=1 Tax=Photorhabdus laumondii TaxID=2218628 RepID=UPI0033144F88